MNGKCVVCGRERTDLIDDQCAECTMDDFWESMGQPRKFAPRGQGHILASLSEFALIGCSICGATGQPLIGSICPNCFASDHNGYTDPGEWADAMNEDHESEDDQ